MLNFLLSLAVSFLGVPMGMLLGKITEEEIVHGKRYFSAIQAAALFAGVILLLNGLPFMLLCIIGIILIYLILKFKPNAMISGAILLFIAAANFQQTSLLEVILPLIFLHGLATGSLIVSRGLRNYICEEIDNPINKGYYAKTLQKIRHILWVVMMETISLPCLLLPKRMNALYHLRYVCPLCPSSRKKHRDVHGNSTCWWQAHWLKGDYNIPRHFGILNWIRQYLGKGTDLKKFGKR